MFFDLAVICSLIGDTSLYELTVDSVLVENHGSHVVARLPQLHGHLVPPPGLWVELWDVLILVSLLS